MLQPLSGHRLHAGPVCWDWAHWPRVQEDTPHHGVRSVHPTNHAFWGVHFRHGLVRVDSAMCCLASKQTMRSAPRCECALLAPSGTLSRWLVRDWHVHVRKQPSVSATTQCEFGQWRCVATCRGAKRCGALLYTLRLKSRAAVSLWREHVVTVLESSMRYVSEF